MATYVDKRWLQKSHSTGHSGKYTAARTLINTLAIVPRASGTNDKIQLYETTSFTEDATVTRQQIRLLHTFTIHTIK